MESHESNLHDEAIFKLQILGHSTIHNTLVIHRIKPNILLRESNTNIDNY